MPSVRAIELFEERMLDIALEAARAGARVVREAGLARRPAEAKQPADYVTQFDRSSEDAIFEILQLRAPGIPILGEERGGQQASTMWTVDPIDGTTNFTRNLPVVAISVALVTDGQPELGVVIAPWLGLEFTAERNRGATRNGEQLPQLGDASPNTSLVATGFPTGRKKRRLTLYRNVLVGALEEFEDIRRCGSSALDLCWTAAGTFDGFFELELGTWDVAVGAAFVLEVGGRVSDWSGGPDWLRTGDILAGSPRIHEALLNLARRAAAAS
jgi:myo-inositol-1(or 4)-monophosphatase